MIHTHQVQVRLNFKAECEGLMCLKRKGRGRYHIQKQGRWMLPDFPQLAVGLKSSDHPCVSWKIPPCIGLGLMTAPFFLVIFPLFP